MNLKLRLVIFFSFILFANSFVYANKTNHIQTIHLGSGCFWGAEKGYEALEGVIDAESGYANGYGGNELPFFEHFFSGGFGSVRGFEISSLGPRTTPDDEDPWDEPEGDPFGGGAGGQRAAQADPDRRVRLPVRDGDFGELPPVAAEPHDARRLLVDDVSPEEVLGRLARRWIDDGLDRSRGVTGGTAVVFSKLTALAGRWLAGFRREPVSCALQQIRMPSPPRTSPGTPAPAMRERKQVW